MSERQVKKHVHAQPQIVRVDSGPGWKSVLEDELKEILASPLQAYKFSADVRPVDDGIEIHNLDFRQMLELPLRSLTASEIFWQIDTRHVGSFGEYEQFIRSVDWGFYLPEKAKVKVRSYSFRSPLYHEGKLDRIARDILATQGYSDKDFEYILRIEQKENRCTAYLALTSEPLFRRRYKSDFSHPAPLQEHLAASAIRWAAMGETPDLICVPFAGSGTLGMESWLFVHHPPMDLWRPFKSLESLPEFPESTWKFQRTKLTNDALKATQVRLLEMDKKGQEVLRKNFEHAEGLWPAMKGSWEIINGDFANDKPPTDRKSVFIPLNPPYGLRLDDDGQDLYRRTGAWIKKAFDKTQRRFGFVFVADSKSYHAFEREIGTEHVKGIQSFSQGGQHIRCVKFDIPAEI